MQHGNTIHANKVTLNQHIHGWCWLLEQAVTSIGGAITGNQCYTSTPTRVVVTNVDQLLLFLITTRLVLFFFSFWDRMGNQYQSLKLSTK
jgi:hypothetical protein